MRKVYLIAGLLFVILAASVLIIVHVNKSSESNSYEVLSDMRVLTDTEYSISDEQERTESSENGALKWTEAQKKYEEYMKTQTTPEPITGVGAIDPEETPFHEWHRADVTLYDVDDKFSELIDHHEDELTEMINTAVDRMQLTDGIPDKAYLVEYSEGTWAGRIEILVKVNDANETLIWMGYHIQSGTFEIYDG